MVLFLLWNVLGLVSMMLLMCLNKNYLGVGYLFGGVMIVFWILMVILFLYGLVKIIGLVKKFFLGISSVVGMGLVYIWSYVFSNVCCMNFLEESNYLLLDKCFLLCVFY